MTLLSKSLDKIIDKKEGPEDSHNKTKEDDAKSVVDGSSLE